MGGGSRTPSRSSRDSLSAITSQPTTPRRSRISSMHSPYSRKIVKPSIEIHPMTYQVHPESDEEGARHAASCTFRQLGGEVVMASLDTPETIVDTYDLLFRVYRLLGYVERIR